MTKYALTAFVSYLAIASPVLAQESGEEGTFCFPTKEITKQITKMEDLKDSKRDTVRVFFEANIKIPEGVDYPERFELRDGDHVTEIILDRETGRTTNLQDTLRGASSDAEMCIIDPDRAEDEKDKMSFSLGMRVAFIETPGTHTLAELQDGLKDGRSHYKKMAGAMGFMVPKFGYVAVASDADTPPQVFVTRNGTDLGEPEFEISSNARLYAVEQIEEMGGDGLRIAGPYRMSPSPDAKTIARFSGGGNEDDG